MFTYALVKKILFYNYSAPLPKTDRVHFDSFCSLGPIRLIIYWWKYKYAVYSSEFNVVLNGSALLIFKANFQKGLKYFFYIDL